MLLVRSVQHAMSDPKEVARRAIPS